MILGKFVDTFFRVGFAAQHSTLTCRFKPLSKPTPNAHPLLKAQILLEYLSLDPTGRTVSVPCRVSLNPMKVFYFVILIVC